MSLFCMRQVSFSLSRDSLYKIGDFTVTFFSSKPRWLAFSPWRHSLDSPGKRLLIRNRLHGIGLWRSVLTKITDVGRPSPLRAAPFPRQRPLNYMRRERKVQHKRTSKWAGIRWRFAVLLTVDVIWPAVWGSCLDSPINAAFNLEL